MTIRDDVLDILVNELDWRGDPSELQDDTNLMDVDALDSIRLISLATKLEERFGITVDDRDLIPEHFETIAGIVRFVEARQSSAG